MLSLIARLILPVLFYTEVTSILYLNFNLEALEATAVSACMTSLVLIWFYGKDQRRRGIWPIISLRLKGCLGYVVLFGLSLCIVCNFLIDRLGFVSMSPAYERTAMSLYSPPFAMQILAAGVIIPFVEELIFRGFAFAAFHDRFSFFLSALFSALLFGLYHGNLPQGVYGFFIGLALAWLYQEFESLLAPYLFHASANILSVCLTNTAIYRTSSDSNQNAVTAVMTAICAIISVFCAIRIYRKHNFKEDMV